MNDAEQIAEGYRQRAANAALEREQIAKRLAEVEDIENAAKPAAARMDRLRKVFDGKQEPLCPSCFLEGRPNSFMGAVRAEDPDSFDAYRCDVCGHYTTVPLRDWGTPSAGWSPNGG